MRHAPPQGAGILASRSSPNVGEPACFLRPIRALRILARVFGASSHVDGDASVRSVKFKHTESSSTRRSTP
jgi:hypothetical protein